MATYSNSTLSFNSRSVQTEWIFFEMVWSFTIVIQSQLTDIIGIWLVNTQNVKAKG